MRRLWKTWRVFSTNIGTFQSRVLLGLFYFTVLAPFGMGVRALRDPLQLKRTTNTSNWIAKNDINPVSLDKAKNQY